MELTESCSGFCHTSPIYLFSNINKTPDYHKVNIPPCHNALRKYLNNFCLSFIILSSVTSFIIVLQIGINCVFKKKLDLVYVYRGESSVSSSLVLDNYQKDYE